MHSLRRRQLLLSMGGLAVAGCSATPTLKMAAQSLGFGQGGSGYPVTRAQVSASPYAHISARFGRLPRAVMALTRYDGEARHWMSVNRVVLVTRYGRLTQTVGLERDLKRTALMSNDPLQHGLHHLTGHSEVFSKELDVGPADYGLHAELRYEPEGLEEIEILDLSFSTLRVQENVFVPAWKWRTSNTYWADAQTGFIWKSRQRFCPELDALEIEVLKPPA